MRNTNPNLNHTKVLFVEPFLHLPEIPFILLDLGDQRS